MSPAPWTPAKRQNVKRKIDKEADRAAARLGAKAVVIIAFFPDGEYLHMQDGGTAPMELQKLYQQLATAHHVVEEAGGADVPVQ